MRLPLEHIDFSEAGLRAAGFVGWYRWSELNPADLPTGGGVYLVVRTTSDIPEFLDSNPAGWFKGRDPSVTLERLTANWVADVPVIYIGKADNLRTRLRAYQRHGAGDPVGHWGGRFVWQCAESENHLVAWTTTEDSPHEIESALLAQFVARFGTLPFANLRH